MRSVLCGGPASWAVTGSAPPPVRWAWVSFPRWPEAPGRAFCLESALCHGGCSGSIFNNFFFIKTMFRAVLGHNKIGGMVLRFSMYPLCPQRAQPPHN